MAIAYLFSKLAKTYPGIRIADNPLQRAVGIIIDHKLRQESSSEAVQVAQELVKMGVTPIIRTLNWRNYTQPGQHPASLPNIESLARTLRYRMLGMTCRYSYISSLFFGHHQDDQYETVLMRYRNGHTYRGCQGIREANAIPECYDLHGVYKSGLLDEQGLKYPYLSFKPPRREMRHLRRKLQSDLEAELSEGEPSDEIRDEISFDFGTNDMSSFFSGHIAQDDNSGVPHLKPLSCEDGGVMIYRPLLQFDKNRLIATCEANNIKWFEDPTNKDVTLTPRNKIRHTDRTTLPAEEQKHVILDMSREAKRRTRLEEAEARRWLIREAAILAFDPNAGTLLVDLPPFQVANPQWRRSRLFAKARSAARQAHQRVIAAIVIRKLIEFVTPDANAPPLANLDNVVARLFPALEAKKHELPPKPFTIAGVFFAPLAGPARTQWFLSRAPYPSTKPLPVRKLLGNRYSRIAPLLNAPDASIGRRRKWRSWKTAKLWDGRYWIRVTTCTPGRFHILPFMPQHAKPFREALDADQHARLDQILKYYAPGKTRYTLPALYSVEEVLGQEENPTLTLLGLPSLGVYVPGLERWLWCETRYRWVDASLLGLKRRVSRAPLVRGVKRAWNKSVRVDKQRAARRPVAKTHGKVNRRRTRVLRCR
ncbi:hypothetical protein E4U55_002019 [Claviceps digitariae]|nr:hypothetical protein E4U55_002019 [Claviceps digitariae]